MGGKLVLHAGLSSQFRRAPGNKHPDRCAPISTTVAATKETHASRHPASFVARRSAAWWFRLFIKRSCDHGRLGRRLLARGREPGKRRNGKRREHQHGR